MAFLSYDDWVEHVVRRGNIGQVLRGVGRSKNGA